MLKAEYIVLPLNLHKTSVVCVWTTQWIIQLLISNY